jgi:hypothetical protein
MNNRRLLPGVMEFVTDQTLFFWWVFLRQGISLGAVAGYAAPLRLDPVGAFLHCFVKGAVVVVGRDYLDLPLTGTDDEHHNHENDRRNKEKVPFGYLHEIVGILS